MTERKRPAELERFDRAWQTFQESMQGKVSTGLLGLTWLGEHGGPGARCAQLRLTRRRAPGRYLAHEV